MRPPGAVTTVTQSEGQAELGDGENRHEQQGKTIAASTIVTCRSRPRTPLTIAGHRSLFLFLVCNPR
jgi:hypothetical protein